MCQLFITHLHLSLGPQHWWLSLCPSCGRSLKAAARWDREQTSSHSLLLYCEEPTEKRAAFRGLCICQRPCSLCKSCFLFYLILCGSLGKSHMCGVYSNLCTCKIRLNMGTNNSTVRANNGMYTHICIYIISPLQLPLTSYWCTDLNHRGLQPAKKLQLHFYKTSVWDKILDRDVLVGWLTICLPWWAFTIIIILEIHKKHTCKTTRPGLKLGSLTFICATSFFRRSLTCLRIKEWWKSFVTI